MDLGSAVNGKIIDYTNLAIVGVVRYAGKIGGVVIPSIGSNSLTNEWTAHINVGTASAAIFCGTSLVGASTYLQLWYIKEDS
jgi:hypothetical protein